MCVLAGLVCLYGAALNPWYLPDTYDNTLYHLSAKSIAEGNGYRFAGRLVTDWPPLWPMILALPHALGFHGVLAAKVVVMLFAVAATVLLLRLFAKDERRHFLAALLVFSPLGFQMGTRIMAEWPYMALSFGFFLALGKAGNRGWSIVSGLLLGLAALTRYTGVFLFFAIAFEIVRQYRMHGLKQALLSPCIAVLVGMLILGLWFAYIFIAPAAGESVAPATNLDMSSYRSFHPLEVLLALANLLFFTHPLFQSAPALETVLALVVSSFLGLGIVKRVRNRSFGPQDVYSLTLACFLAFYETGHVPSLTRYLLPVLPFVCVWFLEGLALFRGLLCPKTVFLWRLGALVWLVFFIAIDVRLMFVGKPENLHGGLSFLVSKSPQEFYRGQWLDLYRACQHIAWDSRPGAVSQLPNSTGYVFAFTARHMIETANSRPVEPGLWKDVVFVVVESACDGCEEWLSGFAEAARYGRYTVFVRRQLKDD